MPHRKETRILPYKIKNKIKNINAGARKLLASIQLVFYEIHSRCTEESCYMRYGPYGRATPYPHWKPLYISNIAACIDT